MSGKGPTRLKCVGVGVVTRKNAYKPNDSEKTYYSLELAMLGDEVKLKGIASDEFNTVNEDDVVQFRAAIKTHNGAMSLQKEEMKVLPAAA